MKHLNPLITEVWALEPDIIQTNVAQKIRQHLQSCRTCQLFVNRIKIENNIERLQIAKNSCQKQGLLRES